MEHRRKYWIPPSRPITLVFFAFVLAALGCTPLLAGLSGPYVFDDYSNLLDNAYVRVTTLNIESLRHAAFSLMAGPFQRPIAMLSFALNYYAAGSFDPIERFRVVNIVLHGINGVLVFWLSRLVVKRYIAITLRHPSSKTQLVLPVFLPALISLFWVAHPIQITSTLYIVQRMTELSALFVLLGVINYLVGRHLILKPDARGKWLLILGTPTCGLLGALSKENAILLPVFLFAIEYTLYSQEYPWSKWEKLSPNARKTLTLLAALLLGIIGLAALSYAIPGYRIRSFTLSERVLTESRVLWFYLSLILVPRLDQFALLHDDIQISKSLIDPWYTLLAVVGLAALLGLAVRLRGKRPLLSLGLLWFFAAHLLESTIFPLELVHEHRNYLALFGICLVVIDLIGHAASTLQRPILWTIIIMPILAAFVSTTWIRATQWGSPGRFFVYEAIHHPDSPGAQSGLGTFLSSTGDFSNAIAAYRRAAALDPGEPAFHLGIQMISAKHGLPLLSDDAAEVTRRLKMKTISATTSATLETINRCILDDCRKLQPAMESWLHTLIAKNDPAEEASFYHYVLGRTLFGQGRINEAIGALALAHELDHNFLLPLLESASIFLQLGKLDSAQAILNHVRVLNHTNLHPRHEEVRQLENAVRQARDKLAKRKRTDNVPRSTN